MPSIHSITSMYLSKPKPTARLNLQAIGRQFTLDDIHEIKDHAGGVDFQQAAREGNVKVIKRYITSVHFKRKLDKVGKGGKNPIDTPDGEGFTAMHYAARYNNIDVMELLLQHGADVNVRDEDGQTPFHHATRYAPKGTALNPTQVAYVPMRPDDNRRLAEDNKEADDEEESEQVEEAEEQEEEERDVLQDIETSIEKNVIKKLVTEDAAVLAIKKFLYRRDTERIKTVEEEIAEEAGSPPIRFLAENGADVNAQDNYGLTALHCAADRGNYPAVLELLKISSVLVNLRDKQGETALHMAVLYEDLACIKKMMLNKERPCNPRIYSLENMSPLHLACRETDLEIVELVFSRIKALELKDSIDNIMNEDNDESRRFKKLCQSIGVTSAAAYPGHVSSLMKKLHKKAREENSENYRTIKRIIDQKFKKAMGETDLKMKGHLDKAGSEKFTCLHLACKDGRLDVVEFILGNGADINLRTVERETALHIAAHKGHADVVTKLVESGCSLESKNVAGETALHMASKADKTEVIQYLSDIGANINAADREGSTPFITAAAWGHADAIRLLLDLGADPTARDKRENSAIFAAIRENQPSVLKIILEAVGERLIDSELDKFQNTPLHFAAELGHLGCLRELLDFKFEINAQNEDDKCPLHLAAERGKLKCVQELVKADKATLEDKDDYGNQPLHYAALNGHVDTTIYLCDMGAEVGARNQLGWTPLDCAASRGNYKVMAALIDADAEIDPIDKAKLTPLHLAAKNGHVDATLFLLNNDANIGLVDVNDMNALELAVLGNKRDVAEAIINHTDEWGRPTWPKALTNAQTNGDTPMKKLIRLMPDIAELVMNKCTDMSNNPSEMTNDNVNFEVQFNYKYITDKELESTKSEDAKSITSMDLNDESDAGSRIVNAHALNSYHINPLNLMIKNRRNELLSHPLVTSLVFCKWTAYGRHFYYGNLFLYALYLVFLTIYTLFQVPPYYAKFLEEDNGQAKYEMTNNCLKSNEATENTECVEKSVWVFISGIITLIASAIRIVIEILQLWYQKHKYISLQNFVELALFALSIFFTANVFYASEVISPTAWQIGVFCLLIAWMNFMMFLRKFPGIGIYIVMFVEVLQTFLKIMLVLVLFIVAFGLTFNMVMTQFPSFKNPGYSILRTFVMMTGEMEYDSYFIPEKLTEGTELYYPESTFIMFVVFVIVVPIVFMNLLVGLAVDDIKEVYNQAELQRAIMKIQLIFQVEALLPSFFLEKKNQSKKTFYPNKKARVLGSKMLARYIGPHHLPFNGPELSQRVSSGSGAKSSKMMVDESKIKKMRNQLNEISKQNKQMLLLMKRLLMKTKSDDTDSVISSELNQILMDTDMVDLETHEDN
ncbi:hypothetical protein ACHWQZ_G006498 [Mnemiopsis leidyi]